jgi:hypothetical protein
VVYVTWSESFHDAVPMMNMLSGPIDRMSRSEAKVEVFRSLFRGRDDIYPRRFESRKTGKAGYAPACANEWVRGVCARRAFPRDRFRQGRVARGLARLHEGVSAPGVGGGQNRRQDGGYERLTANEPGDEAAE